MTAEHQRLEENRQRTHHWKRWGPYLAERAWGTVREDYSATGDAWEYFPHEHARARAYRWTEDGIAGICDRHQRICFAVAMWNEKDAILKERLFGLTNGEGNHGEDVKEYYFYLDSTPTHSHMRYLYKYPQAAFPYRRLIDENARRNRLEREFELMDTGIFADDRYFDVFVEYAKAGPDDVLIEIRVANRGPLEAELHLLPTVWFRNTWTWDPNIRRPRLFRAETDENRLIQLNDEYYGPRWLHLEGTPDLLFTENETNHRLLFGTPNDSRFTKDAIDRYIVHGERTAVNPIQRGTKAAGHYHLVLSAGEEQVVRLRLSDSGEAAAAFGEEFAASFGARREEAAEFYSDVEPAGISEDGRNVFRQACAGLMWTKQFYHYDINRWLKGDPGQAAPPPGRGDIRNGGWTHLYNADVVSMPDKWEYPWYAAWDLAFHCVPIALVDPEFAKEQLILMLREWYMHPNGQLPAYEWHFDDVNPPVHAWAAWRVYKIEKKRNNGKGDTHFLSRVFHKLMLNFTWWVNRKDHAGNNIFQGGFLGLDNIGVFDRSKPLPGGGHLEQSDGTSWMGMYCLNMLQIALELAQTDRSYADVASKFFEHFVYITHAFNDPSNPLSLWDEEDGFYYDSFHAPDGGVIPIKMRSAVGLIPLFATETLPVDVFEEFPGFRRRTQWFIENRPRFRPSVETVDGEHGPVPKVLSLVNRDRLRRILSYLLAESEFLSPYGIRSMSKHYDQNPYRLRLDGRSYEVSYEAGESETWLFGGNSNWRGPIWFPINFLLVESLQKFHYFLGDDFKVQFPTGSGNEMNLGEVACEISRRLSHLLLRGPSGDRPANGQDAKFHTDPHWRDHILFYEYFHGDTGEGLGASHQTGWTALVAKLLQQSGE